MRWSLLQVAVVVVVALVISACPFFSLGLRTVCTDYLPPTPRYVGGGIPPARVLLPFTNDSQYDSTLCDWTFNQHDRTVALSYGCRNQGRMKVHTCPRDCLRSTLRASVWGSYPYHGNSSLCLAAIHSGLIRNEVGGAVLVERFYPENWNNDSSQTLFPHNSEGPSYSNGVQSLEIPSAWSPLPSPLNSYSFTLRSRGVQAAQRQTAPFSPRTGHLHVMFMGGSSFDRFTHHLIIGGRGESGYLTDVWWFQGWTYASWDWRAAENGQWLRLEDAPFTPRADMNYKWIIQQPNTWNVFGSPYVLPPSPRATLQRSLLIIGGQTGHACNQPLLGQCSDEIWELNITETTVATSPSGLTFSWSQKPVGHLPKPSVCGAAVIHDERLLTSGQHRLLGLVGGQVNYTDVSCSTPAVTVNHTWYSSYANLSSWHRGADAPFAPRRSMQEDDSFVSVTDEWPLFYLVASEFGKSISLSGGIRYHSHRVHSTPGQSGNMTAVMTAASVYADTWSCTLPTPEVDNSTVDCDWFHSFMIANLSRTVGSPLSSGSLPIPIAHGASVADASWGQPYQFGGLTSRTALQAWLNKPAYGLRDPPLNGIANLTLLSQPIQQVGPVFDDPPMTVEDSRFGLPLVARLEEEELNDPSAPAVIGSDAVITHDLPHGAWKVSPMLTSMHLQPRQMVQTAEESSWYQFQAASAGNTTRPKFEFRIGRMGHSNLAMRNTQIIAGGHSGQLLSNDWITYHPQLCLFPGDPSYAPLLGAVELEGGTEAAYLSVQWTILISGTNGIALGRAAITGQIYVGVQLPVRCATGYHFEPRLDKTYATLTCMGSGLWLDVALGSVRRCVRNTPICRAPFMDDGHGRCIEPLPVLLSMRAVVSDMTETLQPTNAVRATQVENYTTNRGGFEGNRRIVLAGRWFSHPIQVRIMGVATRDCQYPQLHEITEYCSGEGSEAICRHFGTAITCLVPLGSLLAPLETVFARIGMRSEGFSTVWSTGRASIIPTGGGGRPSLEESELSISTVAPTLVALESHDCQQAEGKAGAVQLVDCPYDRSFLLNLTVANAGDFALDPYWTSLDVDRIACQGRTWTIFYSTPAHQCDERLPSIGLCRPIMMMLHRCIIRMTSPSHTISVGSKQYGSSNAQQMAISATAPRLSVRPCAAGYFTNETAESIHLSLRCQPCPAGTSTFNQTGQQLCSSCPRGLYSEAGWPVCRPCPAGSFASNIGSLQCQPCGSTEWQYNEGADRCNTCGDGQYRVPGRSQMIGNTSAVLPCSSCPEGAWCGNDGVILAYHSSYLLADNTTGEVVAVDCASSACVDGGEDATCQQAADAVRAGNLSVLGVQRLDSSGLAVINCCGDNRPLSIDANGRVNLLCAECLDGFTELAGQCVPCSEVQWGLVTALILLAIVSLWSLHRFSVDSDSSWLSITVYFLQMSSLFLPSGLLPYWLSIVNMSVDSSALSSSCVLPLSDMGKIVARALSPIVALLMLLGLALMELTLRQLIIALDARGCDRFAAMLAKWNRYCSHPFGDGQLLQPSSAPAESASSKDVMLRETLVVAADYKEDIQYERHGQSDPVSGQQLQLLPIAGSGSSVRDICISYTRTCVLLLLFGYNTLTMVCLSSLHIRKVGQFSVLWQFPSIDTSQHEYRTLATVMQIVLALSVIGCPVALLCWLSWMRYYSKMESTSSSRSILAMLTRSFRPQFWFYSVVILLRRLLLILVWTFVTQSTYVWLTMMNYAIFAAHLVTLPYKRSADNILEAVMTLSLSLFTNILAAFPDRQGRSTALYAALITIFTLTVTASLASVSIRLFLRYRERRALIQQRIDSKDSEEESGKSAWGAGQGNGQ